MAQQARRIDDDLVAFLVAAPGIDLGHARHGSQARPDLPVVERAQSRRSETVAAHDVLEHLAESRRDRSECRGTDSRGELDHLQPFADDLAGPVEVRAVLERADDLREAEAGQRPDVGESGEPAHGLLDGEGDLRLDLEG